MIIGDYRYWTIIDEKLHFFYGAGAKKKFFTNFKVSKNSLITSGDERWNSWFPNNTVFSTNCYSDLVLY